MLRAGVQRWSFLPTVDARDDAAMRWWAPGVLEWSEPRNTSRMLMLKKVAMWASQRLFQEQVMRSGEAGVLIEDDDD